MEDNPYSALIGKINENTKRLVPVSFRLGNVITGDPLTVNVVGTIQDEDSLLKNSQISGFMAGDRLLLIPIEDEQRYIIICKVVDV